MGEEIMWAWAIRFLGGLIPGQKPFGEYIGKILYVVAIILFVSLATNVWERLFPRKPDTQIGTVGSYYAEPKADIAGIGCNIMRVYLRTGIKPK